MLLQKLFLRGLRAHAWAVCASLFALTALLGMRAYLVARSHFAEIRQLVQYDLNAQAQLMRIDTVLSGREQAQKKYKITRDPRYSGLISTYDDELGVLKNDLYHNLREVYGNLAEPARRIQTPDDVQVIKAKVKRARERKLANAFAVSQSLYRWIGIALVVCGGITAWLLYLFSSGLLRPLKVLRVGTQKIRAGELGHRVKVETGVTELRELGHSFNSMARQLEQLDQAKVEFLATVSHEIKNPLAALKEGLSLLSTQGEALSEAARGRAFGACLIAAKRLEVMINNLLKLSRGESGLYRFDISRKNLTDAIQQAIDEVRPVADKKKMRIVFDAPEELQAAFNWDGIIQVFENLILNAIKYGEEGTDIEIQASERLRALNDSGSEVPHMEIGVSNTGRPVSRIDRLRIFDRFYRGTNSGRQQGLGIGLHVVKQILNAHHGGIQAHCTPLGDAQMTRMHLWLPGSYETQSEAGAG